MSKSKMKNWREMANAIREAEDGGEDPGAYVEELAEVVRLIAQRVVRRLPLRNVSALLETIISNCTSGAIFLGGDPDAGKIIAHGAEDGSPRLVKIIIEMSAEELWALGVVGFYAGLDEMHGDPFTLSSLRTTKGWSEFAADWR